MTFSEQMRGRRCAATMRPSNGIGSHKSLVARPNENMVSLRFSLLVTERGEVVVSFSKYRVHDGEVLHIQLYAHHLVRADHQRAIQHCYVGHAYVERPSD